MNLLLLSIKIQLASNISSRMSNRTDPLIPLGKEKEPNNLMLPMLLAGPILRRAEPSQVCIWIACSRPFQITAEIFQFRFLVQRETMDMSRRQESNKQIIIPKKVHQL